RLQGDWSSDVCSSDLAALAPGKPFGDRFRRTRPVRRLRGAEKKSERRKAAQPGCQRRQCGDRRVTGNGEAQSCPRAYPVEQPPRSEERRVGREGGSGG